MPRYRLTGRLETGELAELYEGLRDERDRVVIKLFHPRTSDARYAQVMAEVGARLSTVAGDAIIGPVDLGTTSGRLALVREWLDGSTLGHALQRLATREVHPLPPPLALYLVVQLLDGAQKAHEAQVVHGAITPGNVVLGRDGRVALADFGALAALGAVPELKAFTQKGRGTYRAPETMQRATPEPASDVYSLGAIAYELLTLREPSRGKALSTRNDALPPPSRLDRRINTRLDPIILRALEQAPARRFRSCGDMAEAIRNFLSASGGMPSRADVAKWVGDLFPQGLIPGPSAEVPFAGAFSLEPVEGAVLAAVPVPTALPGGEERRPSFSLGALPADFANTIDEPPAWDAPPAAETEASALITSWEAPPGEAPVKRRPATLTPNAASMTSRRVRVVEGDGGGYDAGDEPGERSVVTRGRVRSATPPPREQPASTEAPSPPGAPAKGAPLLRPPPARLSRPRAPNAANAANPPSAPHAPGGPVPDETPLLTQTRRRQRRFLAIASAVALVGVFCLALVVWRFGGVVPDPGAAPVPVAAADPPPEAPPPPPERQVVVPVPIPRSPEPDVAAPSTLATAQGEAAQTGPAFLTLTSNVRAKVYVNGKAVRGHTPLRQHRLEPGTHKIAVVAVSSGERREFTQRFESGQTVTVQERFDKTRRR